MSSLLKDLLFAANGCIIIYDIKQPHRLKSAFTRNSGSMKINKKDIIIGILFVAACVLLAVFEADFIRLAQDDTANMLYKGSLSRAHACVPLVAVAVLLGSGKMFYSHNKPLSKALLWCLPALAVAAVNFPFSALIGGKAVFSRLELIPALALECLAIGLMEELLFRGLLQPLFLDAFKGKNYSTLVAVAVNSALFGLWHLVNLFSGAPIAPTLLQVGYSFLIGAMLSAVFIRVGNIFPCILLHALFDFGGYIVPTLGSGAFQDGVFWALTVGVGLLCGAHVLYYLIMKDRKPQAVSGESATETPNESTSENAIKEDTDENI